MRTHHPHIHQVQARLLRETLAAIGQYANTEETSQQGSHRLSVIYRVSDEVSKLFYDLDWNERSDADSIAICIAEVAKLRSDEPALVDHVLYWLTSLASELTRLVAVQGTKDGQPNVLALKERTQVYRGVDNNLTSASLM